MTTRDVKFLNGETREVAFALGANLYGADLRGADLRGANLRGADLYGADLRGANLRGADLRGADLYGADLRGANLRGADLRSANLRSANLRSADLRGADLRGADLSGADLRGTNYIVGPQRSDGYRFNWDGSKVRAGCRYFTFSEFRAHVAREYRGTDKAAETLAILDYLEARAKMLSNARMA